MGHIIKTPAGTFRANWRDATGRQKAKTFKTRKEAAAFLAETESTLSRGTYVDPHAGRTRFEVYAQKWAAGRNDEAMTRARDGSVMRHRVLPMWGQVPIGQIAHSAVQRWVGACGCLSVFGPNEPQLHWKTIAARLAERIPEHYAEITQDAISALMRKHIRSVQVKIAGTNLQGARRADIDAALTARGDR
jgi:hypothetical protein